MYTRPGSCAIEEINKFCVKEDLKELTVYARTMKRLCIQFKCAAARPVPIYHYTLYIRDYIYTTTGVRMGQKIAILIRRLLVGWKKHNFLDGLKKYL